MLKTWGLLWASRAPELSHYFSFSAMVKGLEVLNLSSSTFCPGMVQDHCMFDMGWCGLAACLLWDGAGLLHVCYEMAQDRCMSALV